MLAEEIRELTDPEVRTRIAELEEERFRLKFRGATETLENPLRLRDMRREIARLKTILSERELAAETRAGTPRPRRTTRRLRGRLHSDGKRRGSKS